MAEPIPFRGYNAVLTAPPGAPEVLDLHCLVCGPPTQSISCWVLTTEEIAEVVRTGRVYVGVMAHPQPPVWVGVALPGSTVEPTPL